MPRPIMFFILVLCLLSCKGYRTLDGRARPVYFSAAPETYTDTFYRVLSVSYPIIQDLKGRMAESTEIRPEEENVAFIKHPTLFYFHGTALLAKPGDKILITGSVEDPTFTAVNGSEQKNKELNFLKKFYALQQYPIVPRYFNASLDTILQLEAAQKQAIPKANLIAKGLFDSLANAEGISEGFENLAWSYIANFYDGSLLWVYNLYNDTLKHHNLYFDKLRSQIPQFNAIKNKADFNHNVRYNLNDLMRNLYPDNTMWSIGNEENFKRTFDTIAQNLTGIPRDYLLSRIMYRANMLGLPIASEYKKQYRKYNNDKTYNRIVRKARREKQKELRDKRSLPNYLITATDNKKTSLEEVLAANKGKLIFIDLWASWCLPCIQEIPNLNELVRKYSKEQVVFISISSDRQTSSWREVIIKYGLLTEYNYLLLDASKTAFYKLHKVDNIPRYLIIGKDGNLINNNAPAPGDPSLAVLLDKLLLQQ